MSDIFAQMLGIDPTAHEARLATEQVQLDRYFLEDLIAVRRKNHSDAEAFAELIGVDLEELEYFESDPLDCNLHFLRLYALGLGALLTHRVREAEDLDSLDYFSRMESLSKATAVVQWERLDDVDRLLHPHYA